VVVEMSSLPLCVCGCVCVCVCVSGKGVEGRSVQDLSMIAEKQQVRPTGVPSSLRAGTYVGLPWRRAHHPSSDCTSLQGRASAAGVRSPARRMLLSLSTAPGATDFCSASWLPWCCAASSGLTSYSHRLLTSALTLRSCWRWRWVLTASRTRPNTVLSCSRVWALWVVGCARFVLRVFMAVVCNTLPG
jgi:hypothetical protein